MPNHRDRAILGVLAACLVLISTLLVWRWAGPAGSIAVADGSPSPDPTPTYVEGMLGRPTSISPFGARTAADRDLVSLVFSGLVRPGPGETFVGDLAERWTVDPTGAVYTFVLRSDATWQDGEPVTAADVLFTIRSLQDPAYTGPGGASWRDVTVTALDDRTIEMRLRTPLAGFLAAATQPIAPAHLLEGVPADLLATNPFGQQPTGSGPYRLVRWNAGEAILEAAPAWGTAAADAQVRDPAVDSLASPSPTRSPGRPLPYLSRLMFRFYGQAAELEADLRAGRLDAASGLAPADAVAAAKAPGMRLLRYPGSTLTAVLFDQRPTHREFADARTRRGLLAAIDRDAIVTDVLAGAAVRADALVPPTSWAFDAAKSPVVAHDAKAARKALEAAGWSRRSAGGWAAPGSRSRATIELLCPDAAVSPATNAVAERIAADWRELGLDVTVVSADPVDLARRLDAGDFAAAVVDVAVGLDPDLYPLLASSQTLGSGTNVIGLQDPKLDARLVAARRPGTDEARRGAYADLEAYLGERQYILPIAWRDEAVVVRDAVQGPTPRRLGSGADRFYDVLAWSLAADR